MLADSPALPETLHPAVRETLACVRTICEEVAVVVRPNGTVVMVGRSVRRTAPPAAEANHVD